MKNVAVVRVFSSEQSFRDVGKLIRGVGLLAMLAPLAGAQLAKSVDQDPMVGVVQQADRIPLPDVGARCPDFVGRRPPPTFGPGPGAPKILRCQVDSSFALSRAEQREWRVVSYSRFDAYTDAPSDTVKVLTTVLFSSDSASHGWIPEWIGDVEYDEFRAIMVESATQSDGSLLLGIRFCFNGTGGCLQHFLHRQGGWFTVEQRFLSQLPRVPDGRLGKSFGIDVATMEGRYSVYGPGDANCCPGREFTVKVALRGHALELISSELHRPTHH